MSHSHKVALRGAFTLVEVMVSLALILMIMAMLLNTVNSTQQLWQKTTAKSTQFQASRESFEAMTRRLSQATLNTYYRAFDRNTANVTAELQYRRQSELEFLSGPTSLIFGSPAISGLSQDINLQYPTHSVFFQAPLGYTEYMAASTSSHVIERPLGVLDELLCGCGYFIEYGEDPNIPQFVRDAGVPSRRRFRLNELTIPGEKLSIYTRKEQKPLLGDTILPQVIDVGRKDYLGFVDSNNRYQSGFLRPYWLGDGLDRQAQNGVESFTYARPLAENVIALVILPKKAPKDQSNPEAIGELAPQYCYDSWAILKKDAQTGAFNSARLNLLPPIVQVTMVAIDEASAQRVAFKAATIPDWTHNLFEKVQTRSDYLADLQQLEQRLHEDKHQINYRIFTADIILRGSKWSQTAQ